MKPQVIEGVYIAAVLVLLAATLAAAGIAFAYRAEAAALRHHAKPLAQGCVVQPRPVWRKQS